MNGIAWKDDVQVVGVRKSKHYANVPGVDVHIAPVAPLEVA